MTLLLRYYRAESDCLCFTLHCAQINMGVRVAWLCIRAELVGTD
jgi:hypothetical protein